MNEESLLASLQTPHKHPSLVLAPSWRAGDFDSHMVDCPFLFRHEGRFHMTYVGWDSTGYRTGLAVSDDLFHWTKAGQILDRGPKGSPTEFNAALTGMLRANDLFGPSELKRVAGRYVGTYHAYPAEGYESGPACIGLCFSTDLRRWEIATPVLHADDPDAAPWEQGGLYKSWLMEHAGVFYLFYNAKNKTSGWPWIEQTGFATSSDLTRWKRHPGNPILPAGASGSFDELFASDPCVLRHEDAWLLFYFGNAADGHAREGIAFSSDLIHWGKSALPLVDVGSPGSLDSTHAHKPGIITRDNRLYHFYCAVRPTVPDDPVADLSLAEIRGIAVAAG